MSNNAYSNFQKNKASRKGFTRRFALCTLGVVLMPTMAQFLITSFPALTSDSLDDYMADNDIPEMLVDSLPTDNVRIYKNNGLGAKLAPHFEGTNALLNRFYNPKDNQTPLQAYSKKYQQVKDNKTIIYLDHPDNKYISIFSKDSIQQNLSNVTAIPYEDINLTDQDLKFIHWTTLAHELAHIDDQTKLTALNDQDSLAIKNTDNHPFKEVMSDYLALQAVKRISPNAIKPFMAKRGVQIPITGGSTHDTAYYLDHMLSTPSDKQEDVTSLETIMCDENILKFFRRYASYIRQENLDMKKTIYPFYMAAIDAQQQLENHIDLTSSEKIVEQDQITNKQLELFIESVHYLVKPERLEEVRTYKAKIDQECGFSI